jgi:pimeloyl-ACP methyl ester carboxylesterase
MNRTILDNRSNSPAQIRLPGEARAPAPLPWDWFDFTSEPRPLTGGMEGVPPVTERGYERAYRILLDNRAVPFKVFRQVSPDGKARPTLLLVHGMGLTIASFRGVAHHLFATHDLVLPDYSSFTLTDVTTDESPAAKVYAHSLWRIIDLLGVEKISAGGNSLGGGLCLLAALMEPRRMKRMVLANPACFPQELPKMYRLARMPLLGEALMTITGAEKLIGGVEYIGYVDKTRFVPELRERYLRTMGHARNRYRLMRIMRHLPSDARDMTIAMHVPRLGEITQPVLISWGLQDPLLVEGAGERLARALPNATYETYPELAHMPHEEAPEVIGPRWAGFLNG